MFSCGGNTRTCKINKKGESSSTRSLIRLPARLPRHVRPRRPLWPPTHRRRSLSAQGHRRKNDHRFVVHLCALRRPLNVRDPDKKSRRCPMQHIRTQSTHACTHMHKHVTYVCRTPPQRCHLCEGDTRLDHRMLCGSVQTLPHVPVTSVLAN